MADEPLVKEPLTDQMIKAGTELTRRLDEKNWPATAAFWYFVPEENQWKLIFASPRLLTHGPAHAYYTIRLAFGEDREQFPSLKQIAVVPPDDEIVRALSLAVDTGWTISGIRFSHNTVNGRFIEDAYLYRIARPRLSDRPTWFKQSPEVTGLDTKDVRVKEHHGEWHAKLATQAADPRGPQAGMCSVRVVQAVGPEIKFTEAQGPVPGVKIVPHEKFLNEAALNSLRADPEDSQFRGLLLELF
jgi:hypothetical protein